MRRLPFLKLLLVLCGMFALVPFAELDAQGWVHHYVHNPLRQPTDLLQCPNGDYLLVDNHCYLTGATSGILGRVSRVGPYGDTIWTRLVDQPHAFYAYDVTPDHRGGYVVAGGRLDTTYEAALYHMNDNGTIDWVSVIGGGDAISVMETADGGFIVGGKGAESQMGSFDDYYFITKTDSIGNLLWTRTLPFVSNNFLSWSSVDENIRIIETPDQDLLIMSQSDSMGFHHGTFLMRTNSVGTPEWTIKYWEPPYNDAFWATDMCMRPDGGLVMVGKDSNDVNIFKITDSLGAVTYTHTEAAYATGFNVLTAISPLHDGGYFLAGGNACMRTDSAGNSIWVRQRLDANTNCPQVLEDDDHYLLMHYCYLDFSSGWDQGSGLVRYDSTGHVFTNLVRGKLYADLDLDCTPDSADIPLSGWVVRAFPGSQYGTTDSLGNYEMDVDLGTYTVEAIYPTPYWQPICPSSGQLTHTFTTTPDTAYGLDFAVDILDCPLLNVEIAAPFLRRCSTAQYYVHYANNGLDTATNVSIQVVMDPELTVNSSTLPWTLPQVGDTFNFEIGTLPPFALGSFYINVTVTCDLNLFGMTHCVSAHIFPDTNCVLPDTAWDLASVAVEGMCVNDDTVSFRIFNQGIGNMSSPGGLVILEDDIMSITGVFDLLSMEDTLIKIPSNGRTMALLAQQRPGHPGRSHPRAFVEGCGTLPQGGFSIGHINTQAQDEGDEFISIDCDQNIGSCDPNEKLVAPEGITPDHFIAATDDLEYTVHFQNTGNDTCFKVVIRDQLDPRLNLLTFNPGPSSHPYTWQIHQAGELEFTFQPILLPDSNINEPGSHGFVTYTIQQEPGNPVGTIIENEADIYFDYNPAVRTNETFNEIASLPWSYLVLTVDEPVHVQPSVKVWPNPFTETATIDLGTQVYRELQFELWDMNGRLVQRQELQNTHVIELKGAGLDAGLYLFRIVADGQAITGKAVLIR